MNIQRFSEILMAYGGNPQHWSIHEREAALQLLASSSEAQDLQQQALQLDHLLDAAPTPEISPALQKRILKSTQPSVFQRIYKWYSLKQLLKLATAFAIPCLVSFMVWLAMPISPQSKTDLSQDVSLLAIVDEEEFISTEFLL
jgi:hypothetical protein